MNLNAVLLLLEKTGCLRFKQILLRESRNKRTRLQYVKVHELSALMRCCWEQVEMRFQN